MHLSSTVLKALVLYSLISHAFLYLIASEQAESIRKVNNDFTGLGIMVPGCVCLLGLSGDADKNTIMMCALHCNVLALTF